MVRNLVRNQSISKFPTYCLILNSFGDVLTNETTQPNDTINWIFSLNFHRSFLQFSDANDETTHTQLSQWIALILAGKSPDIFRQFIYAEFPHSRALHINGMFNL